MNRARIQFLAGLAAFACAGFAADGALRGQQAPRAEVGPLQLRGYEFREARPDRPFREVKDDGSVTLHPGVWEIVIKGDAFPSRALDPVLWLDDTPIHTYRRCLADGTDALVYMTVDAKLLRGEHVMQVIYGNDERTRTKLLERFDPERLVRLPDAERRDLALPELEGVTIRAAGLNGHVEGAGRIGAGELRLAARLDNGSFRLLAGTVALDGAGKFAADVGTWPKSTTHVALLLVPSGSKLGDADLPALPKGIELLDMKPVGAKPAGR